MRKFLRGTAIAAIVVSLGGCAGFRNKVARDGGIMGKYAGDWIVIKYSGGRIIDVFKLKNVMVQSEEHSDGWLFQDDDGNTYNIGGDSKAIRVGSNHALWDKYREYHVEFDGGRYEDKK